MTRDHYLKVLCQGRIMSLPLDSSSLLGIISWQEIFLRGKICIGAMAMLDTFKIRIYLKNE